MPDIDKSIYGQLLAIIKKNRPGSLPSNLPPFINGNSALVSEPLVISHVHRKQQNLLSIYMKDE